MSFHLSRVEWSESKVRWQALNAAEEGKEIITIVQILECSYSIFAGRKLGAWIGWRLKLAMMSSTSMERVTFTAKRFNWKSFSIIVVRHIFSVELSMWRTELKQITIVRLRPICKLSHSSGDNFQIISEIQRWLNDPMNKRKFQFNLTFFPFTYIRSDSRRNQLEPRWTSFMVFWLNCTLKFHCTRLHCLH